MRSAGGLRRYSGGERRPDARYLGPRRAGHRIEPHHVARVPGQEHSADLIPDGSSSDAASVVQAQTPWNLGRIAPARRAHRGADLGRQGDSHRGSRRQRQDHPDGADVPGAAPARCADLLADLRYERYRCARSSYSISCRALLQAGIVDASDEETARNLLGGRSPRASLASLLAAAAAAGRRAVVFLDDVHLLTCPACLSLIRMLLDDSTSELRFVMASRRWPSLDVAKLQLQGTLRLIPAERLKFTLAEACAPAGRGSSRGAAASRLRARARLAGGAQASRQRREPSTRRARARFRRAVGRRGRRDLS